MVQIEIIILIATLFGMAIELNTPKKEEIMENKKLKDDDGLMDKIQQTLQRMESKQVGVVNTLDDRIKEASERLAEEWDMQITEALRIKGYVFKNAQDLRDFAKKKLMIIQKSGEANTSHLYVSNSTGNEYICSWNIAPLVEFKDNNIFVTL